MKFTIIPILLLALFSHYALSFVNFGSNKPHLLFHLGDRSPISLNLGWGYWTMDDRFRLEYQNTKNGLYAAMKSHNGETMFEEQIEDRSVNLSTNIKYQLFESSHWETNIAMDNKIVQGDKLETNWFVYAAVQNNDYRTVDHESYSTFISLTPNQSEQKNDEVEITVKSKLGKQQKISLKAEGTRDMKVFGLTANISETFNMKEISREFRHLVQISQNKNISRNPDPKTVEWEDRQVLMMQEKQNFLNKSFVVVFIYGKFEDSTNIYLTNSTTVSSFNLSQFQKTDKQFSKQIARDNLSDDEKQFTKHVVSNLYGGIAYYFGRLYTQNSLMAHSQDFCFSFTPSRLIFPRSFLWDDGFHQAVAINYNPELVLDVLRGWINKIDSFGWIGRQQIRGSQISSMMPDSTFVFQDWFEMNPPTLMLTLLKFQQLASNDNQIREKFNEVLRTRFFKIEQWYRYFKGTQSHETLQYDEIRNSSQIFYRWQCKDECKKGNFMGSGLDDYPRRMKQNQISKQHVDVVSWLYFFSDALLKLSIYGEKEGILGRHSKRRIHYYQSENEKYLSKLYREFLDPADFLFKDTVVEDKDIFIESFVNKIGYINLFPFFTGMLRSANNIQDQDRIKAIQSAVKIMSDQNLLLSGDGLRSLSLSDELYGTDDNYWRGAIWMPINYMVLRACKLYYWDEPALKDEIQGLYKKLRQNLIKTVMNNYKESGYLFENYYEGKGHRGFPFYGWTSLIVNILTQEY